MGTVSKYRDTPLWPDKGLKERHRVLRELYRHYLDYYDLWRTGAVGTFTHKGLTISFMDLKYGLNELAPRKREAFFYNVILDWKQRDVAAKMGITTVSVGQYVEQAVMQLSKRYFADDPINEEEDDT
jgi:DNA-directed RNA polymerase specialized sigma24 family protein